MFKFRMTVGGNVRALRPTGQTEEGGEQMDEIKMNELKKDEIKNRRAARSFLKEALLLIPNFLKLLVRLFKDKRVPLAEKAFLIGAVVYVISPLDFIPDVIPFVGQVDDLYLVALTLL